MGFCFELRRRRRNSFWQIDLRELIAIVAAAAVVLSIVTTSIRQLKREADAREMLVEPQACRCRFVDIAPAWLRKLSDNSRFLQVSVNGLKPVPLGWRVCEVEFNDGYLVWYKSGEDYSKYLNDFPYLTTLNHWQGGRLSLQIVANAPTENIRRMVLAPHSFTSVKDYRFLKRFRNLEVLHLSGIDLEKVDFEFPILPKLTEIYIDDEHLTSRALQWLRDQPSLKTVTISSLASRHLSRKPLARNQTGTPRKEHQRPTRKSALSIRELCEQL